MHLFKLLYYITTRHWLKSYVYCTLLAPSDWPPLSIVNLSDDLQQYETLSAILIEFITRSLLSCSEIEKHSATMVWFKQRSEEDCPTASEWLTGPNCFAGRQTQGTPRITRHTTIIISWLYRLYNVRWLEATKVTFLNIFLNLHHFLNYSFIHIFEILRFFYIKNKFWAFLYRSHFSLPWWSWRIVNSKVRI